MKLQVLGSSSSGNCYLLETEGAILIIELGIDFRHVLKALRHDLSRVVGAVVSHRHGDHAKSVRDALKRGITVVAPEDVHSTPHPFARVIAHNRRAKLGGFSIYALEVKHDVPCLSYVISHAEMGRLLFVTDTMYFPYRVKGVNHFLIECNYNDEALAEAINKGVTFSGMKARLEASHLELRETVRTLERHDLSKVRHIVLLHTSAHNSNPTYMVREVEASTGVPTYVAYRGLELIF